MESVLAHVSDVNTIFSCQEKLDHAILSKNIMQNGLLLFTRLPRGSATTMW